MLRDKLVFSIKTKPLKEILLRENDLSLHRAIEICRATELAKTQIQAMQNATAVQDSQINAIEKAAEHRKPGARNKSNKKPVTRNCRRCGKSYHFSKVCRSVNRNDSRGKTEHSIMNETDSMYIGTLRRAQVHEMGQIKDSS